jgi:hypothetical protein
VKPVVVKKEEITEEPTKVKVIRKKVIGIVSQTQMSLTLGPIGDLSGKPQ